MKRFYFTSNGNITVHARLTGAFHRADGTLVKPRFEILGIECGDQNGKHAFPSFWWNENKACGGYFHLTREENLFETDTKFQDGSILAKAEPHAQDETEDFFCDMVLGGKHLPAFPIRLPDFGQSAKDRLWSRESVQRWEYKSGEKVVFTDGKTLDQRESEI